MSTRTLVLLTALCLLPAESPGRDSGADGVFSERTSSHFVLLQDVDIARYSGPRGSRHFEVEVLDVHENAYRRVGDVLGLRPRARLRVVVYHGDDFTNRFDGLFRFRAAGFFDGAIHVRGRVAIDQRLVRTLHHEYVHAAFAAAGGSRLPGWVNEGVAEWFENRAVGKRHLSRGELRFLADAKRRQALLPLERLGQGFSGLEAGQAAVAYLQSYATIDHLVRRAGERGLKRFMEQLLRTQSVARALKRTYRLDLAALEANVLAEL